MMRTLGAACAHGGKPAEDAAPVAGVERDVAPGDRCSVRRVELSLNGALEVERLY